MCERSSLRYSVLCSPFDIVFMLKHDPVYLTHAHAPELSSLIYYPVHLCILYMLMLQNYPLSYIILCTCVSYTCSCSRIILSHILSCAPVYLIHARAPELSSLIYPVHLCILYMLMLQNYPLSYILCTCVSYTCSCSRIILSHIYPVHLCILYMLVLQNYPLSYIILCTCVSYTCSCSRIILSHILSCAPVYLTHARPPELSSLIYYPVHLCILYMLMLQNYPLSYIILCCCVSYTCSCCRIILSHILSCAPVYLTHARAPELSSLIYYPVHLCILYMLVLQNYPLSYIILYTCVLHMLVLQNYPLYIILCTCVSYTCSSCRIILSHILSCTPVYLTHARAPELSSLIYYPVHLCILHMLVLQNYPLSYIILCTCVSYTCSCSRIILSHILSCAPVYLTHARAPELSSLIYIMCTCVSYTCSCSRIILSHILSCAPVYLIHAHAPELSSLIYYPVHLCILYMLMLQNYPLSYIILCTCVSYTCSCSRIILSHILSCAPVYLTCSCSRIILSHILSCAPVYLTHAAPELSSLIYYPVHLCILHMLVLQNYPLSYIILCTCVSYTCSCSRIILSHILSCAPVYLIHARAPELSSLIYYPVHLCILHMLVLQNYPLSYIILCTCVSYTCSCSRIILSHILSCHLCILYMLVLQNYPLSILSCAPVYLIHARAPELSSLIYYPVHLCILYMLVQNYPLSYIILCTCVSYTCSCSRIILSHILSCAPVYLIHARARLSSIYYLSPLLLLYPYYPVHLCILYMLVQNYPLSYIILCTCVSYTCSCRIILSHILSCAPVYLIHARAELSSLIYYPVHLCILYMLVQNYPLSYIIMCTCVSYTARAPELSSLIYYPVHLCILYMLVLQNYPLSYIILCSCVSYTCSCSRIILSYIIMCTCVSYTCSSSRIILSHILSCAPVYLIHARAPELSSLIYYHVHLCILYMLMLQNYPLSYIIMCTCVSYTCSCSRIILSHIYPVHLCILYMLMLQNYPLSYIILCTCVSYTCSCRIILSHILSCAPVYLIHARAELSSLIYILCTCVSYTCSCSRIILSHILSCAPVYLIHAHAPELSSLMV